jgi:hypothetical protein
MKVTETDCTKPSLQSLNPVNFRPFLRAELSKHYQPFWREELSILAEEREKVWWHHAERPEFDILPFMPLNMARFQIG